jgi:N,N'-diacetylchitobiose transport system permease protein
VRRIGKVLLALSGVALALIWAFPVYWMVSSSLLSNTTLGKSTPTWFPSSGTLNNYRTVLADGRFFDALSVSLRVTLLTVFVVLIFAFLAALAISRFKFKGRKGFVLALLFIQMLPAEGLFIAQYKMMANAQLLNSVIGISVLYIAAVIPFTVWMLRGFVAGIPAELEEAAQIDGCSPTGAFFRVTFPLLAPGLVASGVYAFLQAWNEFTVALVIMQEPTSRTLPLWLRAFVEGSRAREIDWGAVMASSTLVAVPVIIFFLFVQGRMTSGLVAGAVKG